MLKDYRPGDLPRYLALWTREQIAALRSSAECPLKGPGVTQRRP